MQNMEQILREQVVELTRLLELKDKRIKELEALMNVPGNLILPNQQSVSQWVNDINKKFTCNSVTCCESNCKVEKE